MSRPLVLKILLAGDGGVGKTTLLHKYVKGEFLADTKMTIGVEFFIKEIEVVKEIENKDKQKKLQDTIKTLREDIRKKDENILQLEKNILELQNIKGPIKGQYMRSSNLNDNLYR